MLANNQKTTLSTEFVVDPCRNASYTSIDQVLKQGELLVCC